MGMMLGRDQALALFMGGILLQGVGCLGRIGTGSESSTAGETDGTGSSNGPPGGEETSDPGPSPSPSSQVSAILGVPDPDGCGYVPARVWKLTPEQIAQSVRRIVPNATNVKATLGPTVADSGATFSSLAELQTMSTPHFEALLDVADQAAAALSLSDVDDCSVSEIAPSCRSSLVQTLGARAFRRPLTADEAAALDTFVASEQAEGDDEEAFRQLVRALILSPEFLYRTELGSRSASPTGPSRATLTQYEIASSLSYLLTDAPPDDALMRDAAEGRLASPETRLAHARRLMTSWSDVPAIRRFFDEWFSISAALDVPKDEAVYPGFDQARREGAVASTYALIERVLYSGDGTLGSLMSTRTVMLNRDTAPLYDRQVAGSAWVATEIDDQPRAGLLTTPSFLAVEAQDDSSDIVKRGKFVREALLCQKLPAPPSDVDAIFPPADGVRTQRERLAAVHSTQPSCKACHSLMDPIGYALEPFDGVGGYRTLELGRPIDATGELVGLGSSNRTFDGPAELAAALVQTPELSACFVRTFHDFAFGQTGIGSNACLLNELYTRFQNTGGNVRALIEAWVESDAFINRSRTSDG